MHTRTCAYNARRVDVPTHNAGCALTHHFAVVDRAPTRRAHTYPPTPQSSRRHTTDRQTRQSSQRAKQVCSVISRRRTARPKKNPCSVAIAARLLRQGGGPCCADAQKGVFLCVTALQACSLPENCQTAAKNRQNAYQVRSLQVRRQRSNTLCSLCTPSLCTHHRWHKPICTTSAADWDCPGKNENEHV
jgi:hypothetical protein